jgi:hypothetical protein
MALRGRANYIKLGPVGKAYQLIDRYTTIRLHRWFRIKSPAARRWTNEALYRELGLLKLPSLTRNLPWAKT